MLKERFELIEDLIKDYDRDYAVREILSLAYDYDLEDYIGNIISEDTIDDLVQSRFDRSGWKGVTCMLSKINYLNDEYYIMNGYGNLEELTIGHLECIFDNLKRELLELMEEEEEEEE